MSNAPEPAAHYLYQQVADRVVALIDNRTLKPGDRIPSVRRMSQEMSVAITTVMEAYRRLEDRGFVEARPQSGYYVRPPHARRIGEGTVPPEPELRTASLKPSAVKASNFIFRTQTALAGASAVQLGVATPSSEFLPTRQLGRVLARVMREDHRTSFYEFSPGYAPLRQAIAKRLMAAGCTVSPDDVIITTGATEALLLCLKLVAKPGETVAVESPCYFGLVHLLQCLDLRVVEVASDPRSGVSLSLLETLLSQDGSIKALVVAPNSHNPLGSIMDDEKKRAVVALLEAHDVPIIEDDTYGELSFDEVRPRCLRAFDRSNTTLVCGSFSKTLSPGFRIGWVAAGRHTEQIRELKLAMSLASTTPTQIALARYLSSGGFDRHLRKLRRTCRDHLQLLASAVHRHFPDRTKATRPAGGAVLWVELPREADAAQLFEAALQHRIGVAPGPIFSPTGRYGNCVRLTAAIEWAPQVERAIATLGRLVADQLR